MPELPEVETVARTLARHTLGRRVVRVDVFRPDVVRRREPRPRSLPHDLLQGQRLTAVLRHGKQLALVGETSESGCVCVHLGMSGSLCVATPAQPTHKTDHVHVVWRLDDQTELSFRDPRRFGGVWAFPGVQQLREQRWDRLGPDALRITPMQLYTGLRRTQRALKAALLDQGLLAGLGNIYVDELLYAVRLHPQLPGTHVGKSEARRLVQYMRRILNRAVEAGGSTLRDYVDATGQRGGYQSRFRAYGRFGEPCNRCGALMDKLVVAGRTTTACPVCQALSENTGDIEK